MKKKKIFCIIPALKGGGAESVMITLLNSISREMFEPVFVLFEENDLHSDLLSGDIRVINIPKRKKSDFFMLIFKLAILIRKDRPDILLSSIWYANVITIIANCLTRTKTSVVITVQNLMTEALKSRRWVWIKKLMIRITYPMASSIVAVSESTAIDLIKNFNAPSSLIHVIPNFIDLDKINRLSCILPSHPWFSDNIPVIVSVGRLTRQKGFDFLINAFSRLQKKYPVRLIILGEGKDRIPLESLINKLDIASKVQLQGFVENPYGYIKSSKMFVMSSVFEGLPVVLIEAMACGTPVVSTNCLGANEVITDEINGLLTPVADENSLFLGMEKILNDNNMAARLFENAKKEVGKYSKTRIIKIYEKMFMLFVFVIVFTGFRVSAGYAKSVKNKSFIRINALKVIKPVNKKIFGTSLPKIARYQWRSPENLKSPMLRKLLNELNPAFITIENSTLGLPFYLQTTGQLSHRLSTQKTLEMMNIKTDEVGKRIYKEVLNDPFYNKNQPPHKNYDDLLQFFESSGINPDISIRIPTIFTDQASDLNLEKMKLNISPETGAELVHYLNDPQTTLHGLIRAKNGHPKPYNIKYFVLGNEFWVNNNWHGLSIKQIISQHIAFFKAMKQADPNIKIGINLLDDSYPHAFLKPGIIEDNIKLFNYNSRILKDIKGYVDFVTFHVYGGLGGDDLSIPFNKEEWRFISAQNYLREKYKNAEKHGEIIDKFTTGIEIVVDEFSGPLATLGGALYNAEYIIYALSSKYLFATNWSSGIMEPTTKFGLIKVIESGEKTVYVKRPSYYVLQLFTHHFGKEIVESSVETSTFNTKAIKWREYINWPAEQNIPSMKAIATKDENRLYLMVVNRELDKNLKTIIALNGFKPKTMADVYTLNGSSIDADNESKYDNVIINMSTINNVSDTFEFVVKSHSVTVFEFERK